MLTLDNADLWSYGLDVAKMTVPSLIVFLTMRKKQRAETETEKAKARQINAATDTTTWQVSNTALNDWMNKALQAAERITDLSRQLAISETRNGELQREINDLKDFLQESLDLLNSSGAGDMKGFNSFEQKIRKVLDEAAEQV